MTYAQNLASLGNLFSTQPLAMRNLLINGDFRVAQRQALAANTSGWPIDHWSFQCGAGGGSMSVSATRTAAGFDRQRYWMRINHSVTSPGAAATVNLRQKIEGVDTYAGGQITVSFMGDCSVAGTVHVAMYQDFGTGGSPSALVAIPSVAVNMTPGRKLYTATFTIPTIVGKTIGTNGDDALVLWIFTCAGATVASTYNLNGGAAFNASTGSYYFGMIQAEMGNVATQFEQRPYALELQMCQRYYEPFLIQQQLGTVYSNGFVGTNPIMFKATKRNASYSISVSGLSQTGGLTSIGFSGNNYPSTDSCGLVFTTSASSGVGILVYNVVFDNEF